MPTIVPPMLPTRALADYLGMSIDFVCAEIKGGEIHAVRVGREYRIPQAEAVRYLQSIQAPIPDEWLGR